jgi:hypothetical protein
MSYFLNYIINITEFQRQENKMKVDQTGELLGLHGEKDNA